MRLAPYVPGLSIAEIQERYNLPQVIKMASNENPLGTSPLVQDAIARHAASAFRYPQGGNPRLVQALAALHQVAADRIIIGNGSDELIDLLMRLSCDVGRHNVVTFNPCFGIYSSQASINGLERRSTPLKADFSHDYAALLALVNDDTRLVFITTPDNPSGFCPPREAVAELAYNLYEKNPNALLVVDEAYMDFHHKEDDASLIGQVPRNVVILRTFSKSYGLAGLRIGYAIVPHILADAFWRARLPFSVNILAEEAALAALADTAFHETVLDTVTSGREELTRRLREMGCQVWESEANFLMFRLPEGHDARDCHEFLLRKGIIIRSLKSYGLIDLLRVTVGNHRENQLFLNAVSEFLN